METRQPTNNNYDLHTQMLWLSNWVNHMARAVGSLIQLPNIACSIVTPATWSYLLRHHPSPALVEFFMQGISKGFQIGFDYTTTNLCSAKRNVNSTKEHPMVVQEYLRKEVVKGRVAGLFRRELVPHAHVNT